MRPSKLIRLSAALASGALLTTGCLQSDSGGGDAGDTAEGDGTVTILGAFADAEEDLFNESLQQFAEDSGVTVEYVASTDFTTEIRNRVQSGSPPDIALFPQPGLVLDLADDGDALPLSDLIDTGTLEETLIPGFLDSVTLDDKIYAAPMRMAVKSLVWYPKPEFEEAGYEIPETWQQLMDLSEQIKADGGTPWCIGAEAGADTGWVMTDWVEEMVLRSAGPEVYDQWVAHEIPFNDPAIEEAGSLVGDVFFGDGNVVGGSEGILTTTFQDAEDPMFESPPGCFLYRQGNFATGFFPEDIQGDLESNVGLFVLPPVEGGYEGTPILGGGDMAVALVNDTDVVAAMEFLTSDAFGGPWAQGGGYLSPHKTFDTSQYPDEITRQIAELASSADVFRFDGSDLMPASIGAGEFWDQMVEWVSGGTDLPGALTAIEEEWPT